MTFGSFMDGVSQVLPGVGGILSGILGSASSKRQIEAAKEMNGQNIRLARETNAQQMDMFNRSLDFNANQADLSWQRQKEMFDMENLYNSPIELIKRLTEAGINPQIAFNGMTGYAASADGATPSGGASAPSIPSLTPPQAKFLPDYQSFNPFEKLSQGITQFATAAKGIADAKKAGIDTKLLENTFDSLVQKAEAEGNLMDTKAAVEAIFARPIAEATHQNLKKNLEKASAEIEELGSRVILEGSENALNFVGVVKAQHEINQIIANTNLTDKQKELVQKQIDTWLSLTNSQIAANFASANNSSAQAQWQQVQTRLLNMFGEKEYRMKFGSQNVDNFIKLLKSDEINNIFQYVHRVGRSIDNKNFDAFVEVLDKLYNH